MAKILVDTSIVIEHLRLRDKRRTTFYRLFKARHDLFTSILTHTESYAGKSVWEKEEVRTHLKNLLSGLKILPFNEDTSEQAGKISAQYNIEIVDAIIAATAINNKLTLATLNVRDFEKIDGVNLIHL